MEAGGPFRAFLLKRITRKVEAGVDVSGEAGEGFALFSDTGFDEISGGRAHL